MGRRPVRTAAASTEREHIARRYRTASIESDCGVLPSEEPRPPVKGVDLRHMRQEVPSCMGKSVLTVHARDGLDELLNQQELKPREKITRRATRSVIRKVLALLGHPFIGFPARVETHEELVLRTVNQIERVLVVKASLQLREFCLQIGGGRDHFFEARGPLLESIG